MKDRTRGTEHKKNSLLEDKLRRLNKIIRPSAEAYLQGYQIPKKPVVFIVGPPRSGTTLLFQQLAKSKIFTYPSNFISRFYNAPFIGLEIQELLTNKDLQVKSEFSDLMHASISLNSVIGKTEGFLSPNEFWYFWRRFFNMNETYDLKEPILDNDGQKELLCELDAMQSVQDRPLLFKGLIFNEYMDELISVLPQAKFIHIVRDFDATVDSIQRTREQYFGSVEQWYSFKLRDHGKAIGLNPQQQMEMQVSSIHNAIEKSASKLPLDCYVNIHYESLVDDPVAQINFIIDHLKLS